MSAKTLRERAKRFVLAIRNPLLPRQSREHLQALRLREIEIVSRYLPKRGRLLEIGAGSGWQSRELSLRGYDVASIDIPESNFSAQREWPVIDYDGHNIPFCGKSFDIVFSSNVLEHIPHVREFQSEIQRVLRDDGIAVHLVPSAAWRFWTNLTHPVRYWTPPIRHGEHASNALSEVLAFRRRTWEKLFVETGWQVEMSAPTGLFYSGCSVADHYLSISSRERLARFAGSACNIFVLHTGRRATVLESGDRAHTPST
jgi:SAM-dependent methyltransferase